MMNGNNLTPTRPDGLAADLLDQFIKLHLKTGAEDRQRVLLDIAHCYDEAAWVQWRDPAAPYCTQLLTALVSSGPTALIRYLRALIDPIALGLGPDDRVSLIDMSGKIGGLTDEQWQQTFPPNCFRAILHARLTPTLPAAEIDLDALRAADDRCGTGTAYPKLDHIELLVGCDLKSPCEEFARRLGETPAAGVYTFATAGDQNLLARFVVPRLQAHLRAKPLGRENVVEHSFWAVPGADEPIALRPGGSRGGSPVQHWRDQFRLFAGDRGVDHIVIVWNARLPQGDIAAFADSLQREFYPSLLPTIQQNDQLFFVIWADIEHEAVVESPCYCSLLLPDRLEPVEVHDHLDYQLKRKKVQDEDRLCALGKIDEYLYVTGAKAKSAFPKMQEIVNALKGGTI
jgi:hypothetical protein